MVTYESVQYPIYLFVCSTQVRMVGENQPIASNVSL
jgi:hypothetical protein